MYLIVCDFNLGTHFSIKYEYKYFAKHDSILFSKQACGQNDVYGVPFQNLKLYLDIYTINKKIYYNL